MDLVLFQPEIAPNTGNIARLCASANTPLHLIEPLGFKLEDRYLKRAGLDYWPLVDMSVWPSLPAMLASVPERRVVLTSARRGAAMHRFDFLTDDILILGRETAGLPPWVYELSPHIVRIPFHPERRGEDYTGNGHESEAPQVRGVRSLNLSTAAGILLYQALARTGTLDLWEIADEKTEQTKSGRNGESA